MKKLAKFLGLTSKHSIFWFLAFTLLLLLLVLIKLDDNRALKADIVFGWPYKDYTDNGDYILTTGRLSGPGIEKAIGYGDARLNKTLIECSKESMDCITTYIEQIGDKQTSDLYPPSHFQVNKWSDSIITASDNGNNLSCSKTTLNIDRTTKVVEWVQEPFNQSEIHCKDSYGNTYKWTIEDQIKR